jgi:hypothetical protein
MFQVEAARPDSPHDATLDQRAAIENQKAFLPSDS